MNQPEGMCFVIGPGRIKDVRQPAHRSVDRCVDKSVDEDEWQLVRTSTTKTQTTMTKTRIYRRRGFE